MHNLRLHWTLPALLSAALACAGGDNEGNSDASTSETSSATATTGMSASQTSDASMSSTSSSGTEGSSSASSTTTDSSASASATETGTTTATTDTTNTTDTTDPTDSGGDGLSFCAEVCVDDSDCTVDGVDQGLSCGDNGICVGESNGICADDMDCRLLYSGWDKGDPCNAQGDCAVTQGCIELEGSGYCVFIPSDFLTCEDLNMEEVPMPAIEGGTIDVCGNTTAICTDDEYCIIACQSNVDCPSANFPVCNTDTGMCECGQDSDCDGIPGTSVCIDGACRCGADADCEPVDNADVCNEGACGCSSLRVCDGIEPTFDGTEVACKDFG
jgi:hypothetical protein